MRYSKIVGSGSYLPERIMTNAELETLVDTSDEWIRSRTGIGQRHIAAEGQSTCDLAEQAARNALDAAAITADQIELIIVATTTPDLVFPSTACLLQQRLGNHRCPAFDVQAACTGFIYALDIADKFIRTGSVNNALVIGAEIFSRIINWKDRSTCVLFGDGAGAVVVQASKKPGIRSSLIHADGEYNQLLKVPAGISSDMERLKANQAFVEMQGNEVFKLAVNTLGEIVEEILQINNVNKGEIDWLVPHQANTRIIAATAKKLDLSMDKVILTIEKHGNTSAASIPLALDTAIRDGRIQSGDTLLLEAFGSGFTWGATLIDY